jgi:hypothetical protein
METIVRRMQVLLFGAVAAGMAAMASGATADAVRGGWVADVNGVRHIFILKVTDAGITGTYCAVDCSDPANLSFVERGALTADGVRFDIVRTDGRRSVRTAVTGHLGDGGLVLSIAPNGLRPALPRELNLRRDPRKPASITVEELFARRGVTSGPLVISGSSTPYVPPGPNEPLTPTTLDGLWVWSDGPGRQHFLFRAVGDRIQGMVCGPCDNPWTFGALDNGVIRGDTFTFDINHEDWGIGIEFGPYVNHATATLSRHELHLRTTQQNGPRIIQGDLVLTGPLRTTPR